VFVIGSILLECVLYSGLRNPLHLRQQHWERHANFLYVAVRGSTRALLNVSLLVWMHDRQSVHACVRVRDSGSDSPCFLDNEFAECVLSRMCSVCV
jgi:hypothetical protein